MDAPATASSAPSLEGALAFGGGSGDVPADPSAQSPSSLEVGDSLLDFSSLVLPAPSESERGKLRPAVAVGLGSSGPGSPGRRWNPPVPQRSVTPAPVAGFDHAYGAAVPVHVPSDGAFHTVELQVQEGAAHRSYVVVPRESRDVFRTVTLAEPLGAPLLPGPLDVYVGDRFLTSRALPTTPAGERLAIGLGVEAAIEVARNVRFEEQATGLMRGGLALHHEVVLELENHLRTEARLEVRERVPVPREGVNEIDVKIESVQPPWERWEPEPDPGEPELRGGHRWRVRLAPAGAAGARVRLELRYAVHISAKQQLVGGNRRES